MTPKVRSDGGEENRMKPRTTKIAALALAAWLAPLAAWAEYSEKPVSFAVPFPPGDLDDIATRLIADEFQATYDTPAAVVNKHGVRCNTICPGWMRTEMADSEMEELVERKGLASIDEAFALVTRDVPLGKPAMPTDVIHAAAFLCSQEAPTISGALLTVDVSATIADVPTSAFPE